jgi:hypothetical protein
MLWHFVKLLIGLNLVELFAYYPLLNQFQLDVVVESIAADLVTAEFVVVVVAVLVLVLVDFAAVVAAAVAAAGSDSEQLVEQAGEGLFQVVGLMSVNNFEDVFQTCETPAHCYHCKSKIIQALIQIERPMNWNKEKLLDT